MPRCVVTRRLHFNAAHRLCNPRLSDAGDVLGIRRLKDLVTECPVRHLDHKNLNLDVPWFAELTPTAENIAVVCWRVLEPALKPAALKRIRLWETDRNYVDYHGT
jgi:6-pyruvoyltetrahydropterin/6-carboxytetrahydropterin synthase